MDENYLALLRMGLIIRQRIIIKGPNSPERLVTRVEGPTDEIHPLNGLRWEHEWLIADIEALPVPMYEQCMAQLWAKAREQFEQTMQEHREALKANRGPGWNRPPIG